MRKTGQKWQFARGKSNAAMRAEIQALRTEIERVKALLLSEPQVIIVWDPLNDKPSIVGNPLLDTAVTVPQRILAFRAWLELDMARGLEAAVEALRSRGEGFVMALRTLTGRIVDAEGRALGGSAVLCIKDLTGVKRELVELGVRHAEALSDIHLLRTLIEALPAPTWIRDTGDHLMWVNTAYARAVEAQDSADVVARNLDLLDRNGRESLERAHAQREPFAARLPVIVAGTRRIFDVFELTTHGGSAGIGIDATDIETMRGEMARMVDAHRRTLDQLSTAVAIFGADQRLTFYNAAYRALWGLAADFLDQQPSDSAVLDQLRAARKLPEQADFRTWKNQLHAAYRALESHQQLWHLPDRRTLRVITTPNPEGGVTYLFDDVTERLDLERRFDALIRVQRETLDNLSEGVAVFASDGRLRLYNPAFAGIWKAAPSTLAGRPHIEAVIAACQPLHGDEATWQALRGAVTGLENREPMSRRIERHDGSVVDCAIVPLPDGATLVTFQDVTDAVNVERALRERAMRPKPDPI
jgi:PAS domain-containing protein